VDGVTVTVNGLVVTVEFAQAQNSLVIEQLTAQVRVDSIEIFACSHANTTVEGASEPTCTADGHTGNTVCTDCGNIVKKSEVIPRIAHTYEDGRCTICGCATMGDLDGNQRVNTRDVLLMLQAISAQAFDNLTEDQKISCDVNYDGELTTRDVIIILQAIAAKTTGKL
ncbi:MAG: dockerin type I repeat-containing protein, partial [Oscillospiraceae bacterium]|nr:dockerin type I repeat-containing protein [Oscillospiraceae bacterium]